MILNNYADSLTLHDDVRVQMYAERLIFIAGKGSWSE